jgi:ABC-type antimicrobial peptide transport system permease subunit
MKISDILGMSLMNLWRRKTRTLLTVLGVVIGTAAIVDMLSLGIGLKEAMLSQVESAGGLTEIMVTSDSDYGSDDLLLSDSTVEKFLEIEHVESVEPQIWYYMPVQTGKYEGYLSIIGISKNYLQELELTAGELPQASNGTLELVAGNHVVEDSFFDTVTGDYFWDSDETPELDLMTAPLVGGIEKDEYQDTSSTDDSSTSSDDYYDDTFSTGTSSSDTDDDGYDDDDTADFSTESDFETDDDFSDDYSYEDDSYSAFTSSTKRVQIKVTGMLGGEAEDYSDYSYSCYADIDGLTDFLKQNYSDNDVIPGQPTDRDGKPYRDLKYSQLTVNVDKSDNVETVLEVIQNAGYHAEANKEWLEEIEKEFMIIEAVLGGIGAVSMLVAAISIANTMTMSIYERTKEIGIMKVLGCGLGNIRSMFLSEAAFIGFLGGIAGIVLSYILSYVVNQVAPSLVEDMEGITKISVIPLWLVGLAIVFSTVIGMLAGFFPAQRATKLSPLAAIRNE